MAYSALATPRATQAVLEEFGLYTKHHLGQNFLVNDAVIGKILGLAELVPADRVFEVGPGIGTLTVALLAAGSEVVSVEADRSLVDALMATTAAWSDRFSLVFGDALKVRPEELENAIAATRQRSQGVRAPEMGSYAPNKLVSNLPYQVAATIILQSFEEIPSLERAVVMVQSEVADRISAAPGTKAYGAYTAKLALRARVTGRFEVAPGNFMPPPHVNSAVVRLQRAKAFGSAGTELCDAEIARTCQAIDAAFAQRRKTIRNSMSANGYDKALLDAAFAACDIEPTARAETLSPRDFIRLAETLHRM